MNKHSLWIIGSLVLLLVSMNAHASYFSIQLHNGNEMKTAQYWEDGDKISFYTRSGTVSVPRSMIKNIAKIDGSLENETVYVSPELLAIPGEEAAEELPAPPEETGAGAERAEEFIADLRDRLSIISSNIENLNRNRELFMHQREGYEQELQRAQGRIEEANNESLLSASDRADRVQLENAKISDIESKIARVDEQLRNNGRLVDAQNKMKERVERELAGLTQ